MPGSGCGPKNFQRANARIFLSFNPNHCFTDCRSTTGLVQWVDPWGAERLVECGWGAERLVECGWEVERLVEF